MINNKTSMVRINRVKNDRLKKLGYPIGISSAKIIDAVLTDIMCQWNTTDDLVEYLKKVRGEQK